MNGHKYEAGGTGPMCTLEELMALPHLSKDVVSNYVMKFTTEFVDHALSICNDA